MTVKETILKWKIVNDNKGYIPNMYALIECGDSYAFDKISWLGDNDNIFDSWKVVRCVLGTTPTGCPQIRITVSYSKKRAEMLKQVI